MPRRYLEGTWQKKNRAFSPAVITTGGTTIWVAGHGAPTDDEGRSLAGDFDAQAHQSFKNMAATLEEAGGTLTDLVTMTVFLIDSRYGDQFIEIRKQYFEDFPASAMITVDGFAQPAMMVEIQGIAVINDE
ncbi:MAG: RidA family protein [Rhodospirillales bacterium]|jgi:enamine deaminase RidA (YjgF/YER057c/UK114 family)